MAYSRPSGIDRVERSLDSLVLPKGYGLYDFGGGNTVAPAPDMIDMSSYLTTHCAAIERIRVDKNDPYRITAFQFDMQFVTPEQLQSLALDAVKHNEFQTEQFYLLKLVTNV